MEPKNKSLESCLEQIGNAPTATLTVAQEIEWSLEVLKPYLDTSKAAKTNNNYHNQPMHLSPLLLEQWTDGDRTDTELLRHIQELASHYEECHNCKRALKHYAHKKGYATDLYVPDEKR